jgi:hypothetical protein
MATRRTNATKKLGQPKVTNLVVPYLTDSVKQFLASAVWMVTEGKLGEMEDGDHSGWIADQKSKSPTSAYRGRAAHKVEASEGKGGEIEDAITPKDSFSPTKIGSTKQLWFVPYAGLPGKRRILKVFPHIRTALRATNDDLYTSIVTNLRDTTDPYLKEMSDRLRVNIKDQGNKKGAQIVFVPYDGAKQFYSIIEKINAMVGRYKEFKNYKDFYLIDAGFDSKLPSLYNQTLESDVQVVSLAQQTKAEKKKAEQKVQRVQEDQPEAALARLKLLLVGESAKARRGEIKNLLERFEAIHKGKLAWENGVGPIRKELDKLFEVKNPRRKVRVVKRIRRRR